MQFVRRALAAGCCAVILSAGLQAAASEKIVDIDYLKITSDGFVADTLNGVEARYNLGGPTLYCTEFVERYYEQVYGLELRLSPTQGPVVLNRDDCWFEPTDHPKTEDILFGSGAARGTSYNHWAMVEAYNEKDDLVTVIEQNWRWNGQAGVDRKIDWPGSCYVAYTLRWADEKPEANIPAQDRMSDWAEAPVQTASELGIAAVGDGFQEGGEAGALYEMISMASGAAVTMPESLQADQILSWDAASEAMATAYTVFTGRDALSFPTIVAEEDADEVVLTADGLLVPVSEAAAEGEMSCEQAIALLVWLYENADLDVSGMCEAMEAAQSTADGDLPEHAINWMVSRSLGKMYVTRVLNPYMIAP